VSQHPFSKLLVEEINRVGSATYIAVSTKCPPLMSEPQVGAASIIYRLTVIRVAAFMTTQNP
jgi:hypothetical protein